MDNKAFDVLRVKLSRVIYATIDYQELKIQQKLNEDQILSLAKISINAIKSTIGTTSEDQIYITDEEVTTVPTEHRRSTKLARARRRIRK